MRISDWSSDVCSSDLQPHIGGQLIVGHDPVQFPAAARMREVSPGDEHARPRHMPGVDRIAQRHIGQTAIGDRKSAVSGKSVSVRVALGGRRTITTKQAYTK